MEQSGFLALGDLRGMGGTEIFRGMDHFFCCRFEVLREVELIVFQVLNL